MFFKKAKAESVEQDKKAEDESTAIRHITPMLLKRETKHAKSIINSKLYDTEKSTQVCFAGGSRILFVTSKGNYFSCKSTDDSYFKITDRADYRVTVITYYDLKPETQQRAKELIGIYDTDKYVELFGEVEEA